MNPRYRTPETRAAAVAAYAAGEASEAVAEQFSVSASSVINWARDAGVPIRKHGAARAGLGYHGGWVRDGLVMRPARPTRQRTR